MADGALLLTKIEPPQLAPGARVAAPISSAGCATGCTGA